MTERDPRSRLEDEGIPDLQDGYPQQEWAEDPQQAPVPGDEPVALDDFGTTAEEQREGESLDGRLAREEPDRPPGEESPRAGRLVQQDEGVRDDTESEEVATDVGADSGGFSAEEDAVRVEDET
jgi:uncharacterized protein DUF5709